MICLCEYWESDGAYRVDDEENSDINIKFDFIENGIKYNILDIVNL